MPIKDNRWGGTQPYDPKTGKWATKGTKQQASQKPSRYVQGERFKKLSKLANSGDKQARDYLANFLNRTQEENDALYGNIEKSQQGNIITQIVYKIEEVNELTNQAKELLSNEQIEDIKYNLSDCIDILKGNVGEDNGVQE